MIGFTQYLLLEGGAGGRIPHPFELVKTGNELIKLFRTAVSEIKPETSFLKFDGINVSLKITEAGFAMDRGSSKELDIEGIRPEDLEDRFGSDHGLVEIGKLVMDIFDSARTTIEPELNKLGLLKNPDLLLNIEYISGKTNVIDYSSSDKFLVIHGLREVKPKNVDQETGEVKSRVSSPVEFNPSILQQLVVAVKPFAKKKGFDVIGLVGVELKEKPNIDKVLLQPLKLNNTEKTLGDWLADATMPPTPISRQKYLELSDKPDIIPEEYIGNYVIYYASMQLGDEIKRQLVSPKYGDVTSQEGVIVNSKTYGKYKITGSFFIESMDSKFNDEN